MPVLGEAFVRLRPDAEGFRSDAEREVTPEARRAGQAAGNALGDGLADGARRGAREAGGAASDGMDRAGRDAAGALRGSRPEFTRAGEALGEAAGEGMADGVEDAAQGGGTGGGGGGMQGALQGALSNMKGNLPAMAAGVGLAIGGAVIAGMAESMEQGKIVSKLEAQLGATPAEAKRYGEIAGDLYASAITDDFQAAADTIRGVMANGLLPPDATNAQIEEVSAGVAALGEAFEYDLGETAAAVGQMMRTGLASDATEALDIIAAGLKGTDQRADDVMETMTEYGTIFRNVGLDGADAMGLIRQGLQGGAKDTDKIADAIKEFSLKAVEDSESVHDALKVLGLDGKEIGDDIGAGGKRARDALDKVLDSLRKMPDSAEKAKAIQDLFGGPGEDLGAALFALDVDKAADSLGDMEGAAKDLGDTLHDNAATRVEQFKRGLQQNFVEFLGDKVIPALQSFKDTFGPVFEGIGGAVMDFWREIEPSMKKLGEVFADIFEAFGGGKAGGKVHTEALKIVLGEIADIITEFATTVGEFWDAHGEDIVAATKAAWETIKPYVGDALEILRGLMMIVGAFMTGDWSKLWDGVQIILAAAWEAIKRYARQALEYLKTLMRQSMEATVDRMRRAWDDAVAWTRSLPGRLQAALSSLAGKLRDRASRAGQDFKNALYGKFNDALSWLSGLPSRISSAIGGLGSLLYGKGQDVARGLLNGIQSMGSYIASSLRSWAASIIPGPIAQALGIRSPSKVMADQVGRWIPAGIVEGILSGSGALQRTMANLVPVPPVPALAGAGVGAVPGGPVPRAPAPRGPAGPAVHIEHWHAAGQDEAQLAESLLWKMKGRGYG